MGSGFEKGDFAKDAALSFVKERIKTAMQKAGASDEMADLAGFIIENSVAYVEFCAKLKKNPEDTKALLAFLATKSKAMATAFGNDDLKCAIALFDFANGLYTRVVLPSRIPGGAAVLKSPIPATIITSLTLLDLLGIANSCNFVQEAYYHVFLQSSSPGRVPGVSLSPSRESASSDVSGLWCETPPSDPLDLNAARKLQSGTEMRIRKDAIVKDVLPLL